MNFLFIMTTGANYDLVFALREMGHTVTVLEKYPLDFLFPASDEVTSYLRQGFSQDTYDYVFTFPFVPQISNLCMEYHIPYISWIYDSPLPSLFSPSVLNPANRIFIFDYAEYERLLKIPIPNIFYMPLASSIDRANSLVLDDASDAGYHSEISFVGNLYEKNAYNQLKGKLPPEIITPINLYLMKNLCDWHQIRPWPLLSKEVTDYLHNCSNLTPLDYTDLPENMYLSLLYLSPKLAEMERITILDTLAEHHPVDLYTESTSDQIGILNVHPPVDYYTELGKVYYYSKINLNITLASIETGVPMRIFDIMSYGGFVLSNYQKDFDLVFEVGKDLEVYHDIPELLEKTDYYLSHEKERLEIAVHGYQTVNRLYSYQTQLGKILNICESLKEGGL